MLQYSNNRRRYYPPTLSKVVQHAGIVYLGSAILALLEYVPGIPVESAPQFGSACLPLQYDLLSTVFFYAVFLPLLALIPILLVAYYAFDVWRSSILPTTGKGRNLAVYFARVIVCFAIMWLPAVILIFMAGGNVSPWVSHCGTGACFTCLAVNLISSRFSFCCSRSNGREGLGATCRVRFLALWR